MKMDIYNGQSESSETLTTRHKTKSLRYVNEIGYTTLYDSLTTTKMKRFFYKYFTLIYLIVSWTLILLAFFSCEKNEPVLVQLENMKEYKADSDGEIRIARNCSWGYYEVNIDGNGYVQTSAKKILIQKGQTYQLKWLCDDMIALFNSE